MSRTETRNRDICWNEKSPCWYETFDDIERPRDLFLSGAIKGLNLN